MDKLARLMAPAPQLIEPWLLAEQHKYLTGELKLSTLPRLLEVLASETGQVHYQLNFAKDPQGIVCILGSFGVDLQMYCQRCMNPMTVEIERDISVGVVATRAEADVLPEHYDPLIVTDSRLSLVRFIEDEILLGMPMALRHESDDCPSSAIIEKLKSVTERPFAKLKGLVVKNQ